jgi:hypothetical protein
VAALPLTTYRRALAFNERSQVVDQTLGNGVEERSCYDLSTGMMLATSAAPQSAYSASGCPSVLPTGGVRLSSYAYDQFLNLAQQSKQFWNSGLANATETFAYDDLQRLLGESRTYSGYVPSGTLSESYNYDLLGNVSTRSDYQGGTAYSYQFTGTNGSILPHAVSAVGAMAFGYDANGNQQTATLSGASFRTLTYDLEDRPSSIVQGNWPSGGSRTRFSYTPDGDRYLRVESTLGSTLKWEHTAILQVELLNKDDPARLRDEVLRQYKSICPAAPLSSTPPAALLLSAG